MSIRVAINGFGRIGRLVFRALCEDTRFQAVAVNDLADAPSLANLVRYDSVHGRFKGTVEVESAERMIVNGQGVQVYGEREISALPWKKHAIDFVVESTGIFRKRAQIQSHLDAGAGKVVLTVPPKDDIDALIVLGVNEGDLKAEHRIITNAS